ncbi:hypothetical protein Plec18167_000688 [Paecilomyces lecythidis]|uniref:Transcription factor RfeG n=1 Tax=Paecilomyces lecythidis TaxID=3004212 RepID=A0ABR3YG14_9EURO
MTGRHGYDGRPERQNEYFIPGDGISREVIQADICRYLGNDALVKPGTHNGQKGYLIRAYRNLTSEMIADLKADSARWEADVSRRADLGYPRGSYVQDMNVSPSPNIPPASYAASAIHEMRQQGPSPQSYSAAPPQPPHMDPYMQPAPYGGPPNPAYPTPSSYTQPPYYPPPQNPYSGQSQPPVSTPDMHPSYTYTSTAGYAYEPGRNNAPRYPGPGYENDADYAPVTSGIAYPATTAPDPRIGMDPRYTPESAYSDHRAQSNRPQQARGDRDRPRR